MLMRARTAACGSPPRAWGQLYPGKPAVGIPRFTPTGVGTIVDPFGGPELDAVHPHGRGDNRSCGSNSGSASGSPPRAWGQSRIGHLTRLRTRFTPTGVGTMKTACLSTHPGGICRNASNGSPPRAWGQYGGYPQCGDRYRFTPTGVGTIWCVSARAASMPVHPHGRGDNCAACAHASLRSGSPPRAWGQWHSAVKTDKRRRFTPTGVGTIPRRRWPRRGGSVHPHGRGDNSGGGIMNRMDIGSPPRAWGQ